MQLEAEITPLQRNIRPVFAGCALTYLNWFSTTVYKHSGSRACDVEGDEHQEAENYFPEELHLEAW